MIFQNLLTKVVSCFPEGHGELPTPPPTTPPSGAALDHEKGTWLKCIRDLPWDLDAGHFPFSNDLKAAYALKNDSVPGLFSLQQLPVGSQAARANAIRDSIRHAWSHYKQFAWGMDELLPLSARWGVEKIGRSKEDFDEKSSTQMFALTYAFFLRFSANKNTHPRINKHTKSPMSGDEFA